jgi:hypothetical protein
MTLERLADFSKPMPVDDVTLAFPANALDYMPPREVCEAHLEALPDQGQKWIDFQRTWFFSGLAETTKLHLREGIDGEEAMRHLKVIQGSFAPKHEHKEAAVAYLASLWFDDVKNYKRAA